MLRIYMARHGQDMDNLADILNGQRDQPLTELGEKQAREVAEKIKTTHIVFDKVYSSPLKRAFRTAEIISENLGIPKPPEILELLIERDFGILTGQHRSKIKELCGDNLIHTDSGVDYFLSPKGGETFPDLMKRAEKLLDWIFEVHKDGNILLVGHGDMGKMIYAQYYQLEWQRVLKMFHFGNSELILLAPDSSPEDVHVFRIEQHNL